MAPLNLKMPPQLRAKLEAKKRKHAPWNRTEWKQERGEYSDYDWPDTLEGSRQGVNKAILARVKELLVAANKVKWTTRKRELRAHYWYHRWRIRKEQLHPRRHFTAYHIADIMMDYHWARVQNQPAILRGKRKQLDWALHCLGKSRR